MTEQSRVASQFNGGERTVKGRACVPHTSSTGSGRRWLNADGERQWSSVGATAELGRDRLGHGKGGVVMMGASRRSVDLENKHSRHA